MGKDKTPDLPGHPVLRLTVMYDPDKKAFYPVMEETELAKQLGFEEKKEIMMDCVKAVQQVDTKAS